MAVSTREDLVLLLKKFLATTINPAQTAEGSFKDKEAFDNVKQIIAVALIADTGSIYSVLKIAADEYAQSLRDNIADIDSILSVDGLLGIGSNAGNAVDVNKLRKASLKFQALSNSPSESRGKEAAANLEDFIREEMLEFSLQGNTERSIQNIKEFEKKVSNAWKGIIDKKNDLSTVVSNFSKDSLIEGALEQASRVMASNTNLAAQLLSVGTVEDFGEVSRAIELLTAGTKAFLDFIFNGDPALGTTIVDPSRGWSPFIPETFIGNGTIDPASYVAKGDSHRIFLDYLMGSSTGYATNLPVLNKKAKVYTKDETFDLSSAVDTDTSTGSIFFIVNGEYEYELQITSAELIDTNNWANPYTVSASELYSFIIGKYSVAWAEMTPSISGTKVMFSTFQSNKHKSTIEMGANSYLPFLSALGIEEGLYAKGEAISNKFQDTNITSSSSSWNDSPVSLRTDGNEDYHLLVQTESTVQEITSVTEDDLFIEISPGIDEASTDVPYAITVEKPGKYIQPSKKTLGTNVQVPVRKPPTATNYLGEELDGGFIVHEGKTGKIQTTVLTLPNYDESASVRKGSTWNGYGTDGYWKPIVKSRGKFTHTRTAGTGIPAPLKAAGNADNFVRPGMSRFGSTSNYYGTGTLGEVNSTTIYNTLFDFLVSSPPVTSSDNEAKSLYFRDSAVTSSSPVTGIGFGPQIYEIKVGDYFRIASSDSGGDGTGNLSSSSNYVSGSAGSNIFNNGHRVRSIKNWFPTHTFSRLVFLPALDLPLGINSNANSLLDTDYNLDPNLGSEIDGINIEIIHSHRFTDTSADFISDGISPGDVIILHETDYGVTSYITSANYLPNDSSVSTLSGSNNDEKKQQFDTSWVKAFEVAYVESKNTLYLNTGWVSGENELGSGANLFNTPFTTKSGYRDIPQPAFTTDAQSPYNNSTDGYDCWYQVLRRGALNYENEEPFASSGQSNLLALMDSDYYSLYQESPSSFKQTYTEYYNEESANPTFSQANIKKGDIVKISNVGNNNYGAGTNSYRSLRSTELEDTYQVFSAQEDTLQVYRVDISGSDLADITVEYTTIPTGYGTIYSKPQGFDFYSEDFEYEVYAEDWYKRFFVPNGDFVDKGVTAGMTLQIYSGSYTGSYTVESVESNTTLLITADGTAGNAGFSTAGQDTSVNFAILVADNTVYDPDASFQSDSIEEDDIFVYQDSSNVTHELLVSSVTDQNTLVLKSNLPETDFTVERNYLIKKKADSDGFERTTQFAVNVGAGGFTTTGSNGGFDDLPDFSTLTLRPVNMADPTNAADYEEQVSEVYLRVDDPSGASEFTDNIIGSKGGIGWDQDGANGPTTNDHLIIIDTGSGHKISTVSYDSDSDGLYIIPGAHASANLDWTILMGKESPFFEDTTKTFTESMEGDRITLNPGVKEYSSLSPYAASTGLEFLAEIRDVIDGTVIRLNRNYPVETSDGRPMSGYWTGESGGSYGSDVLPTGDIVLWLDPENVTTGVVSESETYTDENVLRFHGSGGYGTDGFHYSQNSYLKPPSGVSVPTRDTDWSFSMWMKVPLISEFNNTCTLLTVFDDGSISGSPRSVFNISVAVASSGGGQLSVNASHLHTSNSYTENSLYYENFRTTYEGQWVLFTVVWDGDSQNIFSSLKIYVNATEISATSTVDRRHLSLNAAAEFSAHTNQLILFSVNDKLTGNQTADCHRWEFNEIAAWDHYLTSSQATELYNSGNYYPASSHSQSANLSGYWACNSSESNTSITTNSLQIGDEIGSNHLTNTRSGIESHSSFGASAGFGSSTYTDSVSTTVATAWTDVSGNSNNASQATDSNKPGVVTSAINGYTAVSFDGVDDFMTISDANTLDMTSSNGVSIAMVIKLESFQTNGTLASILSKGDTSPQYRFGAITNATPADGTVQGFSYVSSEGSADSNDNTATNAWAVIFGASSSTSRYGMWTRNGTIISNDITIDVGAASSDAITIGALSTGSNAADVQIAEIILFSGVLNEDDREATEGYLAHKYGIESSLRSDHPYVSSEPVFTGELFGGKDKLMYTRLPQDYPQPGHELLADGQRYEIEDVVFASNAGFTPPSLSSETAPTISMNNYTPALKLVNAMPIKMTQSPFFIVQKGEDPFSTEFTAESVTDRFNGAIAKGFKDVKKEQLIGKSLLLGDGKRTRIRDVLSGTRLKVDAVYEYVKPGSRFKIELETPDNALRFFTNQAFSGTPAEDDYLSVWTVNTPARVESFVDQASTEYNEAYYKLKVPGILSGIKDQYYTVSRGGDPNYGHFVLFEYLLERINLSNTFLGETLKLSEVIDQRGTDFTIALQSQSGSPTGTAGVATTQETDETSATKVSLGDSTPAFSAAATGQRLKIVMYNTTTQKHSFMYSYVESVDTVAQEVSLYIPVKKTSSTNLIVDWELQEGSAPESIRRISTIRNKFSDIITLIDQYQPQTTNAVESALNLLSEQGLDRAADLLKEGDIAGLLALDFDEATYAGKLSKDLADFGRDL